MTSPSVGEKSIRFLAYYAYLCSDCPATATRRCTTEGMTASEKKISLAFDENPVAEVENIEEIVRPNRAIFWFAIGFVH